MDGYSVDEAASVLGIPPGRVWELLARGVLVGTPEGETGMRVFLKPPPGPMEQPGPAAGGAPGRGANGNGGHLGEGGEMSPFRELLHEFRSLTERYGQALLALGEARGEVAALRSRVELLEARIDLRLPPGRPASTIAWEIPDLREPGEARATAPGQVPARPEPGREPTAQAEPGAEPAASATDLGAALGTEGEPEAGAPSRAVPGQGAGERDEVSAASRRDRLAERRYRQRRGREAMRGIMQALERAQDPALAGLPGASEAAEALAAFRGDPAAESQAVPERQTVPERQAVPESRAVPESQATPEASASPAFEAWVPSEPSVPGDEARAGGWAEAAPLDLLAVEEPIEAPAVEGPQATLEAAAEPEAWVQATPPPVEPVAAAEPEAWVEAIPSAGELPDAGAAWASSPEEEPSRALASVDVELGDARVEEVQADVPAQAESPAPLKPPEWASRYSTDVIVEPDWFADGDFTWLDAAELDAAAARHSPAAVSEHPERPAQPSEPREEPDAAADATGAELDAAHDERLDARGEPDTQRVAPPDASVQELTPPSTRLVPTLGDFRAPEAVAPEAVAPEASVPGPMRGPAGGEEELMWLGDEFEAAGLEIATPGWRSAAPDEPQREPAPRAPILELSEGELEKLAQEQGWDIAEVRAIRSSVGRAGHGTSPDAAREPDAEQAAGDDEEAPSDDGDHQPGPPPAAGEPANDREDGPADAGSPGGASGLEPAPPAPFPAGPRPGDQASRPPRLAASDRDWLRGRRGPAATAYRRLRRLFPG